MQGQSGIVPNPLDFATDILGVELWAKQREVLGSLVEHRRVAVKSAGVARLLVTRLARFEMAIWMAGAAFGKVAPQRGHKGTSMGPCGNGKRHDHRAPRSPPRYSR